MIEIALCLAIIGFALVAIIGVLPTGLDVQKNNREETIVDQDAQVWMDALRNGAQGFDSLTNYVLGITNYWTQFSSNGVAINGGVNSYTYADAVVSGSHVPSMALTNGANIIGRLSTPEYTDSSGNALPDLFNGGYSNYLFADVRAISGSAVEKPPQNNLELLQDAFAYRLVVQNMPYVPYDTNAVDARVLALLQANSHDIRLLFRWPMLPNGDVGNGRHTFRLLTGGRLLLVPTDDAGQPVMNYFIQPAVYTNQPMR